MKPNNFSFLDIFVREIEKVLFLEAPGRIIIPPGVAGQPETCAREVLLDNRCGTRFFFHRVYESCMCELRGKDAGIRYFDYYNRYRLRKGKISWMIL